MSLNRNAPLMGGCLPIGLVSGNKEINCLIRGDNTASTIAFPASGYG